MNWLQRYNRKGKKMNSKEQIKFHLTLWHYDRVDKRVLSKQFHTSESNVRKALLELMNEGNMVFYPIRTMPGQYMKFTGSRYDITHIESEVKLLTHSMATMYFKRLQVYKKLLKAHAKELQFPMILEKIEQMEIIFGEIAEMEGKE